MALFVCLRSGYRFYSKMVPRFGIESMHEMRNSENNHRDYGIAGDKVRDVGFPLFKARNSGFKAKRWQDSGLKSMQWMRDLENNRRDYDLAREFGSG